MYNCFCVFMWVSDNEWFKLLCMHSDHDDRSWFQFQFLSHRKSKKKIKMGNLLGKKKSRKRPTPPSLDIVLSNSERFMVDESCMHEILPGKLWLGNQYAAGVRFLFFRISRKRFFFLKQSQTHSFMIRWRESCRLMLWIYLKRKVSHTFFRVYPIDRICLRRTELNISASECPIRSFSIF